MKKTSQDFDNMDDLEGGLSDFEDVEGEEEPEPEPDPELTEEERVARMGMRERIQYELAKIAEQEEVTRVRIARENQKRELVRQIKEEMAKIRGLDVDGVGAGGNNQAQGEDLPGWVKMVQSAELKRAAASGVERSSEAEQEGQDAVKDSLKAESIFEGDHQSKQDVAKADSTEADSKPTMTFEESVSALLDLIEEEKKPKRKPTLLSKKKDVGVRVNCNLKVVSDAKHKFEELSSGASPTSCG